MNCSYCAWTRGVHPADLPVDDVMVQCDALDRRCAHPAREEVGTRESDHWIDAFCLASRKKSSRDNSAGRCLEQDVDDEGDVA